MTMEPKTPEVSMTVDGHICVNNLGKEPRR